MLPADVFFDVIYCLNREARLCSVTLRFEVASEKIAKELVAVCEMKPEFPGHKIVISLEWKTPKQLLGLTSKVCHAVNGAAKYGELAGGTWVSLSGFERIVDEDGVTQHYSFWLNKLRELPKKSTYPEMSLAKTAKREADLACVA
ncbi:hypothetical protein AAVH_24546 [Aphelenchoides avenae]|nr:hypothetical protein AAVH_24546 [Aphelenchus avenae]